MEKLGAQWVGASTALGILLCALPARGAAFLIDVHSGATMGRVSGVTATIDDPSAVWHNPAGLTSTEGTEFTAALTLIRPRGRYVGPGLPSTNPNQGTNVDQRADSTLVPVPSAFVSHALSSKAFVGFGFYLPYGLRVAWNDPDSFAGRTVVQEIALKTYFMTPTIALRLSEQVSVALGVSLVPSSVYLRRTLGASDNGQVLLVNAAGEEGEVEIAATAFGVGMTAGVQVALIDHLKLGLAYRSAIALDFTGNANFTVPTGTPATIAENFPDQTGSASITLPHTLALGVGWRQQPFVVETSAQISFWNSTKDLSINFDEGKPTPTSSAPRDWKVVPKLLVGGAYEFDKAVARVGLGFDWSPIPTRTLDPTLPDANRLLMSLGGGYDFGLARVDIAYMAIRLFRREVTLADGNPNLAEGTYEGGFLHLFSTSVGVKI